MPVEYRDQHLLNENIKWSEIATASHATSWGQMHTINYFKDIFILYIQSIYQTIYQLAKSAYVTPIAYYADASITCPGYFTFQNWTYMLLVLI